MTREPDPAIADKIAALGRRAKERRPGQAPSPLDPYREYLVAAWDDGASGAELAQLLTVELRVAINDERVRRYVHANGATRGRAATSRPQQGAGAPPSGGGTRPRRPQRAAAQVDSRFRVIDGGEPPKAAPAAPAAPAAATAPAGPQDGHQPTAPQRPRTPEHRGLTARQMRT